MEYPKRTLEKHPEFKKDCDITRAFIGFSETLEAGHTPDSPECMKWINWLAKERGETAAGGLESGAEGG